MAIGDADIARALREIADLLELDNGNPFRVRAYRYAAEELERRAIGIGAQPAGGADLPKIQGVGADLAGKIREIAGTGTCAFLEELRNQYPPGITQLFTLPGLGPRRVRVLYDELKISSLQDLLRAARAGRLRSLARFGEKSEKKLLEAVQAHLGNQPGRFKRDFAARYAEPFRRYLETGGDKVVIAGSYRRKSETVGDLDFLATSRQPKRTIERFVGYPEVKDVLARGTTRASVVLGSGLQVDLRVVPERSFGAALHYFTGSKPHNIALRKLGLRRGLKINEYGVFRGERRIAGETEESVYAAVGLPWIAPEKREGDGAIALLGASGRATRARRRRQGPTRR